MSTQTHPTSRDVFQDRMRFDPWNAFDVDGCLCALPFASRAGYARSPDKGALGIIGSAEQTKVGGTAANTPSELNAQVGGGRPKTVAGGTLANTPTELSGGVRHRFVGDGVGTNTPAEISGEITMVNGNKRVVPRG
jgi:hypothetical protein